MNKREGLLGEGISADELSPLTAAAHELKSPLALVRQLALRLEESDISDKQRRLIQQITLTSERALRLTSDLTRSARLDDALFELEPINPEQICQDIAAELAPLFEAHGRSLQVSHRTHPLLLVANRDLLRRIIMNFSDNALYYSQPGTAVHMQIQALTKAGTIRVGIRDFGPALSSDMWRALQKKLKHSPQPVHARPQSSGLGLFIASQFAQAMDGTIGATRHRDGATFYVELQASRQLSLL
ncbi:HAMP domain-containing histidine kinase [Candidatus Saccharibacteria bacterium]|nr:HAMP domain-containing histidine kinase [Candidatus Saccharibacteria bacterium]